MSLTAIAVLAAGGGTRLGERVAKPLLELRGRPLVAWAVDAALASGLAPVLLVVGHEGEAVAAAAPASLDLVWAPEWRRGIAHSLRAALDALEERPEVDGVCVGLADQPLIGAPAYRRLAATGARLAVATYGGERGNPVLLGRDVWPQARALRGDTGARGLFDRLGVVEVDCTGTGDPGDVDTLEDLDALERGLERRNDQDDKSPRDE